MSNEKFWNARVVKFGHTGWADPFIYCFDQEFRISFIRNYLVGSNATSFESVLDYGCGDGGFSRLLGKYARNIHGVDISSQVIQRARDLTKNGNITYEVLNSGTSYKEHYDLILSITVMQHMNDHDFELEIKKMSIMQKPADLFILVESTSRSRSSGEYFINREPSEYEDAFSKLGYKIIKKELFYHPIYNPSKAYEAYSASVIISLFKWFYKIFKVYSKFLLRFVSRFFLRRYSTRVDWNGSEINTYLWIFEKI